MSLKRSITVTITLGSLSALAQAAPPPTVTQISLLPPVTCKILKYDGSAWQDAGEIGMTDDETGKSVILGLAGAVEIQPNGASAFKTKISGATYEGYPSPPAQAVDVASGAAANPFQLKISLGRSKTASSSNDQVDVRVTPMPDNLSGKVKFTQIYDGSKGGSCATSGSGTAVTGALQMSIEDDTTASKKTKKATACPAATMAGASNRLYAESDSFTWTPAGGSETNYIFGKGKPLADQSFRFKAECVLTRNPNKDKAMPNSSVNINGTSDGGQGDFKTLRAQ